MPLAKDIPACPNPPAQRPSKQVTRNYTIELLTPMFGGGVVASEIDESMPFRSTSIRGHLQFWWRATKGAQFETAKELAQRHEEIWGSTKRASPVKVEVFAERFEARRCANFVLRPGAYPKLSWDSSLGRGADELAYVLFPFQGKATRERVEKEPSTFIPTGSFQLRLLYPESLEEDVTASVRSWVNFGGLGARTRRGCGAVYCKEYSPLDREHLIEMLVTLSKYVNGSPRPWPTAAATTLLGVKKDNALASWQDAVKALRDFRQAPGLGRNVGQGARPGRSRFPEPETIRKVTRKRSQEHRRLDHIPDNAFPRGEFGLPINFHI
jgi:CRISPR-associated protein Cmr1